MVGNEQKCVLLCKKSRIFYCGIEFYHCSESVEIACDFIYFEAFYKNGFKKEHSYIFFLSYFLSFFDIQFDYPTYFFLLTMIHFNNSVNTTAS